ncbi:carbon monoxide dehydrogenase subunit G [Pseudorhodoferax sp. Leaf267]|uniref:SRPBCC family protein n=1 Tax=Pseudorhodoferax sp. Leaf267 TaxID=1736316 RepID=UPI0009EC5482|nr:carbon monoxide dehydrogenase subunit G [Pseudorhodoferax sp. Leaf267]
MEMQGSRQLAVTQQQAWDALNDPEVLKICIPGCDKVEPSGDNQYAIGMALKIGPVSAKFAGKISLSDIVAPASYTIGFEGQGGVAGHGKGTAKVALVPNEGGCELQYGVTAQVGGKVAQLGQRLIDGAAKSLSEDFFKRFDNEMRKRFPSEPAEGEAEPEPEGEEAKAGWLARLTGKAKKADNA